MFHPLLACAGTTKHGEVEGHGQPRSETTRFSTEARTSHDLGPLAGVHAGLGRVANCGHHVRLQVGVVKLRLRAGHFSRVHEDPTREATPRGKAGVPGGGPLGLEARGVCVWTDPSRGRGAEELSRPTVAPGAGQAFTLRLELDLGRRERRGVRRKSEPSSFAGLPLAHPRPPAAPPRPTPPPGRWAAFLASPAPPRLARAAAASSGRAGGGGKPRSEAAAPSAFTLDPPRWRGAVGGALCEAGGSSLTGAVLRYPRVPPHCGAPLLALSTPKSSQGGGACLRGDSGEPARPPPAAVRRYLAVGQSAEARALLTGGPAAAAGWARGGEMPMNGRRQCPPLLTRDPPRRPRRPAARRRGPGSSPAYLASCI